MKTKIIILWIPLLLVLSLSACKTQVGSVKEFDKAMSLYDKQDYSGALTVLKDYQRRYPDSLLMPAVKFYLAKSLHEQEKIQEAIPIYKEVIAKYPKTTWASSAKEEMKSIDATLGQPSE